MSVPLKILSPVDGAILNRHDGSATDGGLRIEVRGTAGGEEAVEVNGRRAERSGGGFVCPIILKDRETRITARFAGSEAGNAVSVLWDRNSDRRYRVSTEDNILFLKDLAANAGSYRSIFDNFYLGFWRRMHRRFGIRLHLNIYFGTDGFDLSQMPEVYKSEWRDNAGWLRLTFHALHNDPARPYLDAGADVVRRDFDRVTNEIARFAGEDVLSPFTTIHWGEATREACRALRAAGIAGLIGWFKTWEGKPEVAYYLDGETTAYLGGRDYWKDTRTDLFFITADCVLDQTPVNRIVSHLSRVAGDPHREDLMELVIHEQYFWPGTSHFLPDAQERVVTALRWMTEEGYRPVFYEDGFLGSPE